MQEAIPAGTFLTKELPEPATVDAKTTRTLFDD